MVCCRPLWASAPLSTSEDHSSQSAQVIGYSKADVKYVPGPPTTNQLPHFSQFVLVEWTESKVRSPKWPHPLPAFTHGRKRNHVVHVYSCHHLAAPRDDAPWTLSSAIIPTSACWFRLGAFKISSHQFPHQVSCGLYRKWWVMCWRWWGSAHTWTGKWANQANVLEFVFV